LTCLRLCFERKQIPQTVENTLTTEDVQQLRAALGQRAAKTVNNVLTTLGVLLKAAVEWGVMGNVPCTIRLLKMPKGTASFYDFDESERLVEAARRDSR
jgi:hypothetical protein